MDEQQPLGVRYVIDVAPEDLGVRVSLRRRLAEGGMGDVLGVLTAWSDGELTVERADGTQVVVAEPDLVALKRIPPQPVRRR